MYPHLQVYLWHGIKGEGNTPELSFLFISNIRL
jgi:hypothetical protein